MKKLDLTLGNMENSRFNYIYGQLVSTMETTVFSRTKLLCLSMVFNKFVMQNGPGAKYMTAVQLSMLLRVMFKISSKRINDRIVRTVCYDTDCKDSGFSPETHCTLDSFIKMFTIYFSDDDEKRMRFVFDVSIMSIFTRSANNFHFPINQQVYDEDGSGALSRPIVMYYIDEFFEGDDEDEAQECRIVMISVVFINSSF